ncbi:hypothetical protein G5I_01136 [Acromyrmex echinatior]|uniref:Uncharacterized protein n=1 Tax=Acromyrmex echinatior TaxID=103372 RepID=F4W6T1_ACREC|nr:hypothetical protein G5I_01136 [Acromyrmex echinatior]
METPKFQGGNWRRTETPDDEDDDEDDDDDDDEGATEQRRHRRVALSFPPMQRCHFFNRVPARLAVFEPRTDVAIIDRGRFHCDDLLSVSWRPVGAVWFYRGCYYCVMPSVVPPPLRESSDLERETAARFSRHILSAVRRRTLRSV